MLRAVTTTAVLVVAVLVLVTGLLWGFQRSLIYFPQPRAIAQFSPIWWGLDAMRKLAGNESGIGLHLVALFAAGLIFATVGTFFFRRRMGL